MTGTIDVSKLQAEVNNLVARRLQMTVVEDELLDKKDDVNARLKAVRREYAAIDALFREKLDELNRVR